MFNIPFKVDLKSILKSMDEIVKSAARTGKQANSVFQAFATGSSASVGKFSREVSSTFRQIGVDASKVANGGARAFGQLTREGSKSFRQIGTDVSKVGSSATRTFGVMSREGSRAFNSLLRDSSRTMALVARDIASAFKNVSGGGFSGGRGGVLSWITPGIGLGFGSMIADGIVSAVKAPFQMIGQAMADSMELTAVNRKFNIVFDNARVEADRFARDWAEKINGSVTQTKAMMTRFQDTAVPLGFNRSKSYEMSKSLTMLTTDLVASEPGFTTDDVAARLQSAIVGNHEAMRIFGVALSETTLKQELMTMGIKGGIEKATEQEKVLARLNLILRSTRDAHGAAGRAQGDLRQQLGGLNAVVTETSSRFGMVFAPAVAQVISLVKDCVREINVALGPSEQWGKTLAEATKSILSNASGIKEYFTYIGKASGQMILTAAEGMKSMAGVWNDPKAFYGNMIGTIQNLGTMLKPHLIFLGQEMLKIFGGIGGAIAGAVGVSTNVIQEFIKVLLDELLKVAEAMEQYASNIPGTQAYSNKKAYIAASNEFTGKLAGIDNMEQSGYWDSDFARKRRNAARAAFESKTEGLTDSSTKPIRDALAKMTSGLSDKDFMAKVLVGASEGYKAGSSGVMNSSAYRGLGDLDAATAKAQSAVQHPADKSFYKIFSDRLNNVFQNTVGGLLPNPDSIRQVKIDKKSKFELDAEQEIKNQEKAIKKLNAQSSGIEFTTSESLWNQMQTAFADKDEAVKVAEKQLGVLRQQLDESKASREAVGKLGQNIGIEITKFLGYAE